MFTALAIPGENVRIAAAIIGLMFTTYFDIFNKKNVPDMLLYVFLILSVIINIIFFDQDIFILSVIISVIIAAFGYTLYKLGQIGAADIYVLLALNFLLPIHPSTTQIKFNFPFIASVFVFSGVVFALYFIVNFSIKLFKINAKPNFMPLLLLIPYGVLLYLYINSFFFSAVYFSFISILVIASVFFLMYRESIHKLQAERINVSKLENGDVLALELMDQKTVKKYSLQRLVTESEFKRLKKLKLKEILVYTKLPPFLPFVLIGFILALYLSGSLLLF